MKTANFLLYKSKLDTQNCPVKFLAFHNCCSHQKTISEHLHVTVGRTMLCIKIRAIVFADLGFMLSKDISVSFKEFLLSLPRVKISRIFAKMSDCLWSESFVLLSPFYRLLPKAM